MRGIVVLLVLIVALIVPSHLLAASSSRPGATHEVTSGGPRVVLGNNPKTTQREVQLVGRGFSAYPTVDITCDGQRWTLALTRSEAARNRTAAIYAVPEDHAGRMRKAVECRLLIPGRDIALARQHLRTWASPSRGAAIQREAGEQKRRL